MELFVRRILLSQAKRVILPENVIRCFNRWALRHGTRTSVGGQRLDRFLTKQPVSLNPVWFVTLTSTCSTSSGFSDLPFKTIIENI